MDEKPWQRVAQSFLILYSVLAAISGVLLSIVLTDDVHFCGVGWVPGISLALAVFLFIYTAEKILDALDEQDVEKYVALNFPYNLAVVLLIFGLITVIYFKYELGILNRILAIIGYQFTYAPTGAIIDVLFIFVVSVFVIARKWWKDTYWLLTKSEREYQEYIEELKGERTPEFDRGRWFKRFKNIRKCFAKDPQPDFKEVRLELRPSAIDGVGVFAARQIEKGKYVAEGLQTKDYGSLVSWAHFDHLDKTLQEKISDFCIGTPEGFFPPDEYDFNKLSVEWFMNHTCNGNVGFDEVGNFVAIKEIESGEEMTYDYALAESNPRFKMKCKCGNKNCRGIITGDDWKDENFRKCNLNHMLPYLRKLA